MATLSTYDAVLKEFYEGAIRDAINNTVVAFKDLNESSREWSGRRVLFPFKTGRNSGVGARSESSALPTAGNQQYQNSIISSTYQYGKINLTGQVLEAGKNAFASAMETEMRGVTDDLINDLGRQTWGYGDGRLAQIAATAADAGTTAITVHNRFQRPGQNGARYIQVGQVLDGGTVASPQASWSAVTVSTVTISTNPATTTDTVEASAGGFSGATGYLFNRLAGGAGVEMAGIQGLVDDFSATNIFSSTGFFGSTVQNINRAQVENFNSIILANSGVERILDGNLMQQAFDEIDIKSGLDVDLIWGHHSVVRAFLENVSADRRYAGSGNGGIFDAGAKGGKLSYQGVEMIRDRQAPYNSLLVAHRDVLKVYKLSDFKFADNDGAILSRATDNTDSFDAYIRSYLNLGLDMDPKGAVMIRDIKVDF